MGDHLTAPLLTVYCGPQTQVWPCKLVVWCWLLGHVEPGLPTTMSLLLPIEYKTRIKHRHSSKSTANFIKQQLHKEASCCNAQAGQAVYLLPGCILCLHNTTYTHPIETWMLETPVLDCMYEFVLGSGSGSRIERITDLQKKENDPLFD